MSFVIEYTTGLEFRPGTKHECDAPDCGARPRGLVELSWPSGRYERWNCCGSLLCQQTLTLAALVQAHNRRVA